MSPLSAFNVDQLLHIFLFPFFATSSNLETVAFCYCSLEISINLTQEPLLSCRVVFYGRLYLVCKLVYRLYQTTLFMLHLVLLVHRYQSFSLFYRRFSVCLFLGFFGHKHRLLAWKECFDIYYFQL